MRDGTATHMNLKWCEGCQSNVKPKFAGFGWECPRCGTSLGGGILG